MSGDAAIDLLHPDRDKPAVFAWLRSYLRWQLTAWSRDFGLAWTERDIDQHIDRHHLIERDWSELSSAHSDDAQYVAVARARRRAVGIVHAAEHGDRYLQLPIGVLSWLFVEPLSRGHGISQILLSAAHRWMAGRGLPAAEVFVTADNAAALRAYGRAGYRMVDHRMIARIAPASELDDGDGPA